METEKIRELYTLFVERLSKGEFGGAQSEVYQKILKLISQSESVKDAQEKIKNSDLYLEPTRASFCDKLTAYIKAARENEMTNVEVVYQDKLEKVLKNFNEVYDTNYLKEAQNQKIKYFTNYEKIACLYKTYIEIRMTNCLDSFKLNKLIQERDELFNYFEGNNLELILNQIVNQNLFFTSQKSIFEFISYLEEVNNPFELEKQEVLSEVESVFEDLNSIKTTILEVGNSNLSLIKNSNVLIVPPTNPEDKYRFFCEEIR